MIDNAGVQTCSQCVQQGLCRIWSDVGAQDCGGLVTFEDMRSLSRSVFLAARPEVLDCGTAMSTDHPFVLCSKFVPAKLWIFRNVVNAIGQVLNVDTIY